MTQYGDHTGVEKLQLSSKDWTSDHVAKIAELFPQVLTESKDEHGRLRKAINFDKLKDILSFDLAEGRETYEFTWVGKRDAMAEAGRPTTKTLRPDLAESVNFDETENVFITGDNLEVLKILQESYLNKIDMIYIDPPYNTGKDFVYSDKFQMSQEEMDEATESLDETGQRLVKNEKSNARYHSDWLSMMYPRLVLARNLLKNSGVVFISIDDNEQANLKALCDEVFGEENFFSTFKWNRTVKAPSLTKTVRTKFEYILLYVKNSRNSISLFGKETYNSQAPLYNQPNKQQEIVFPPNSIRISKDIEPGKYSEKYQVEVPQKIIEENGYNKFEVSIRAKFKWGQERINRYINEGNTFQIKKEPSTMYLDLPTEGNFIPPSDILSKEENGVGRNEDAQKELASISIPFDFAKPSSLVKELLNMVSHFSKNLTVLDFFGGSATTADAVMQLNAEDGGNRKYILCTLDETVADKSVAKEAGYDTIDQISRERIRRAADKIRTENPEKAQNLDFGFKAFKLDSSNFKEVYQSPERYQQVNLLDNISNIKEERNDLDLLFQVMLTWGMELSLSVKKEQLAQLTIYNVAENALIACFAEDITEDAIRQIAQKEPLRAVFKDSSFANSADKINLAQIFKEVSPMTKVKVV
ncbi:site-specific DNA-methyltransferase [Streptococcus uberis]|uniref:site-specific DNA-methyltransferase n=1 Tax=Streptococcus uberis TaxID=1349 RepID=UPI00193AC735|nr:site-specific DNA-methyltransferase [Streptococcus uberis]